MKLEVGMYCYNKTNRKLGIGKIINFQRNNNVNIRYKNDIELVSIGNVIANNEIISLIEVGDYINGLPVRFVEEDRVDIGQAEDYFWLKNQHIKSIVTKEQMEAMEYKVADK